MVTSTEPSDEAWAPATSLTAMRRTVPATRGSTFGTGSTRYGFVGANSEATTFNGALGGTPSFFVGDVDDLRIYHRALSAAEVAGMAGRTDPFEQP